jgi:glycosyltransferase involved in cell wall biosynthesis
MNSNNPQLNKRLTIVTDSWLPSVNGVITTLKNTIKEAEQDGWTVTVIHPGMFKSWLAPGSHDVMLSIPFGMGKKIAETKPDHIHIAVEGPLGIAAVSYCKKKKIKYTTAYHTKWPEFLNHIYKVPTSITVKALRWFHKGSERVLTTTQTMVDELRDQGISDKGVAWTRGVNADVYADPRYEWYSWRDNQQVKLVSVGRISKEKNLDAFCKLDPNYYDLTVVGDGPYLEELKENYPHVKFVGMKHGKELAQYYRDAEVMVFTSKTDTFGLVMIESMYMGTPVAAFPVPGPIDVIKQNVTGFCDDDLKRAIGKCLAMDRKKVANTARKQWTWRKAWEIMRNNLV